MHSTDTDTDTNWTFAELASTYRFWALLALTVLVFLASWYMNLALAFAHFDPDLHAGQVWLLGYGQWISTAAGFVLGLLLLRRADLHDLLACLVVCTALSGAGTCLYFGLPIFKHIALLSLQLLQMALPNAVWVFVIARLASTCRAPWAIASVFALVMLGRQSPLAVLPALGLNSDPTWPLVISLLALALASALLWPIRQARFDAPPPARAPALQPRYRSPGNIVSCALLPGIAGLVALLLVGGNPGDSSIILTLAGAVGLAGLVSCYHWLYRVHGEVQHLLPSRRICQPWSAVLIALLIPLAWPILLLLLGEEIRSGAARRGLPVAQSQSGFHLCCILVPFVAMGQVQHWLNVCIAPANAEPDA